MKNIIIGTAGHIDHGKTTLIKALTGRNTDRLKEEKKRGISIELGFTYFDLPSGRRAGIIDVPGHEKFIKHMLAGVGGMDIVMLVIAADEGIMPQTKEHLHILSMLGIKKGMIVITKSSMVEQEWIELIEEDIKNTVKGTFLENAPMNRVDSIKGEGITELINDIDYITEQTENKDIKAPVRMPIDRVFTIVGFGTVVTGTLIEGEINVEETVEILPQKVKVRIRNIQVHGNTVDKAFAGQRVAINLANVKKEDIERGQVLAQINSMESTMMIDAKVIMLRETLRKIENRDRIRIYHGSSEILSRVSLLDRESLLPGETGFVQFRLEEETVVKKGDKMVIRFYSPMETIGGAEVIDATPKKHKRFDQDIINELIVKERGKPEDILESHIKAHSHKFPDIIFFSKLLAQKIDIIKQMVEILIKNKKIIILGETYAMHAQYYEELKEKIKKILEDYQQSNPLKLGILKEELKSKVFTTSKSKQGDAFLILLEKNKIIKITNKYVSTSDFEIRYNNTQLNIKQKIEDAFLLSPFSTPKLEDVVKSLSHNKKDIEQVIENMLGNELIKINHEIFLHNKAYLEAKEKIVNYISENGSISLAEFRDLLNTSRKYGVAILEYFDNNKVTKRLEDKRVLF